MTPSTRLLSNRIARPVLSLAGVLSALSLAACAGLGSNSQSSTGTAPATVSTAATATFTSSLSAAAEVPPNTSPATGTLTASLNKVTNMLTWRLMYSGLTGQATMAHLHGPAMPGTNAGVVVPFPNAATPSEGSALLTPAQVADLMAGKWYVNVHTNANPGGEIRGQVIAK